MPSASFSTATAEGHGLEGLPASFAVAMPPVSVAAVVPDSFRLAGSALSADDDVPHTFSVTAR